MLTKDQAQAASDALLQPAREKQRIHDDTLAQQRLLLAKQKWVGGGALLGLAIGSAIGSYFAGQFLIPGLVGIAAGAAAGMLVANLRA